MLDKQTAVEKENELPGGIYNRELKLNVHTHLWLGADRITLLAQGG